MKKKVQHYVFQAYLKPWANNGQICCLRNGKIFFSNLSGVACERFFYKLQDLTPEEVRLIDQTLIEGSAEPLRALQRRFLYWYSLPLEMRKDAEHQAESKLTSALDEIIVNAGEDYHQQIENSLLVFLNSMLAGDTGFYSDDRQAVQFLYALSVQFTRTKQVREAALAQFGAIFNGCDVRRVFGVLSYLIAMSVGQGLFIDRKRFRLILIENSTDTPFITADQPIINLHGTPDGKPPEKLEFFYPLSPTKAMLFVEASTKLSDAPISAIAVNNYNVLLVQNSHEQVFSNSEEYLNSIRGVVKREKG